MRVRSRCIYIRYIQCLYIYYNCIECSRPNCMSRVSLFSIHACVMIACSSRSTNTHSPSLRRACLGQCFSYSVPNTFPQSTESLIHCDSCMPAQTQWEVVRLLTHWTEHTARTQTHTQTHTHTHTLVGGLFCGCLSRPELSGIPQLGSKQLYAKHHG